MFMRGTVMVPPAVAEALGVSVHATRGRIQIATQPGAKPAATTKLMALAAATAAKPHTGFYAGRASRPGRHSRRR